GPGTAEHACERVVAPGRRQRRGGRATRDERGEHVDLGERLPVGEALAPHEGVGVDLAAAEAPLHLGDRDRTDLLLIDDDVPDRLVAALGATVGAVVVDARLLLIEAGRRRLLGARGRRARARAADHDDVAALLAADLEDLAFDLVVG